jgi:hypothetical protein
MRSIEQIIAEEIGCQERQVNAAVALLDEGSTVPFIARYRKEVTGGLDAALSARDGRTPRDHPEEHHRTGKAYP